VDSRTKRHLPAELLEDLARRALGGPLQQAVELLDGTFNVAYRLVTTDGRVGIVKAAPTDPATLLRHEHGIMRTEAIFYGLAADVVPVPEIIYADFDRDRYDTDVIVMSELPGVPWSRLEPDAAQAAGLRHQLGRLAAELHTITGTTFGYPQASVGLSATTWPEAFLLMTRALLADAEQHGVTVPATAVVNAVAAHQDDLAQVDSPVLVHFDLWPGNIFVSDGRITGFIDAERALWADPLAEFATLLLFRELDDELDLVAGYVAGGGTPPGDGPTSARLALYRMYLDLIMLIEAAPRGYAGPERERFEGVLRNHLDGQLARLQAPAGGPRPGSPRPGSGAR
jgi:aminoglycoside phosphotransferase (APT) family kinase protein